MKPGSAEVASDCPESFLIALKPSDLVTPFPLQFHVGQFGSAQHPASAANIDDSGVGVRSRLASGLRDATRSPHLLTCHPRNRAALAHRSSKI